MVVLLSKGERLGRCGASRYGIMQSASLVEDSFVDVFLKALGLEHYLGLESLKTEHKLNPQTPAESREIS